LTGTKWRGNVCRVPEIAQNWPRWLLPFLKVSQFATELPWIATRPSLRRAGMRSGPCPCPLGAPLAHRGLDPGQKLPRHRAHAGRELRTRSFLSRSRILYRGPGMTQAIANDQYVGLRFKARDIVTQPNTSETNKSQAAKVRGDPVKPGRRAPFQLAPEARSCRGRSRRRSLPRAEPARRAARRGPRTCGRQVRSGARRSPR